MARIGYLRYRDDVSSLYDSMQRLISVGINSEMISMGETPTAAIESLEFGDCMVVGSLCELANGLPSLMRMLCDIFRKGAVLESLDEPWFGITAERIDWATFFEGMSDFGRHAVSARTRSALSDAVRTGRKLGRPVGSISAYRIGKYRQGLKLYRQGSSIADISRELQFSRSSFVRWLDRNYPDLRKAAGRKSSRSGHSGKDKIITEQ